ncbi:proton/glutamate symporter [Spiroplasma helicoides]|uniref:L-cystine uptake protein TcyP n=1 Tax=Spiroplasma helicoides TaxID=216938 RepID=A0A1B3SM60_9MOLU|nr:dicarboxylate/amino acid:cation symporter [Spiroplasma helicoides]AOG61014.1 proton/glutamate symporter [Spiroplasma helicoides]
MIYTSTWETLEYFISMSSYKSVISIVVFFALQIGLWFALKRFKNKFLHLFSGLVLGLVYGVIIQASVGFPESFKEGGAWKSEYQWIADLDNWSVLFKQIFIITITLLMIPLIFLSIYRAVTKKSSRRLGRVTAKGVAFLMVNVAVAFIIAAVMGILIKVGVTSDGSKVLDQIAASEPSSDGDDKVAISSIPAMIVDYLPKNVFASLAGGAVIPVIILALIVGLAVKFISKKSPEKVVAFSNLMEASWEIVLKIVNGFIKIIPLAIMSIVTNLMITQSLTALTAVAKVLAAAYVSLFICAIYLTAVLAITRIKPHTWWKQGWRPPYQGLVTQSSSATLPFTMKSLVDEMKVDETCVSTIIPLSTTMGMIGGAGAEGGLIMSLLWTGSDSGAIHDQGIVLFLLLGLIMTMIISFGIPGTPGTSTLVITSLLNSLGVPSFKNAAFQIMLVLEDIFDIGRTATNILAAMVVSTIVAFSEGMISPETEILSKKARMHQAKINSIKTLKDQRYEELDKLKVKFIPENSTTVPKKQKAEYVALTKDIKTKYRSELKSIKGSKS